MPHHLYSRCLKPAQRAKVIFSLLIGLGCATPAVAYANELHLRTDGQSASIKPTLSTSPTLQDQLLAATPQSQPHFSPLEAAPADRVPMESVQVPLSPAEIAQTNPSELGQPTSPSTLQAESSPGEVPQPDSSPESAPTSARDPMLLYNANGWEIRAHLQFGLNAIVERNLYWDLAATFAPTTGFDADTDWLELYIKPGISFTRTFSERTAVYGKVSAVASLTLGTDAFDFNDTGRVTLEEGYLGLRTAASETVTFDFSVGPRELKLGTGMLVANGASNGFERGALKFGPRKAWEFAAIGRLSYRNDLVATLFYLDPNELPSNNSRTNLMGIDLRYDRPNGNYVGLTYVHVLNSDAAYPQATLGGGAPTIIPGARDGLNALSFYTRVNPFQESPFFFTFDGAYEWNSRINLSAWAGRIQLGYTFKDLPWSPTLTYTFQTFSGDDPSTSRQERFDPLYYEGSPSSWGTGSKSSVVFINTNVRAHQLALRLAPSPKDTVTLRYAHVRVNELFSPVQFGQATRFDFSVGAVTPGVTNPHLSDDFFLEYSRVLNRNTFLTVGVSASIPGAGITTLLPQSRSLWYGAFVNVVFNF